MLFPRLDLSQRDVVQQHRGELAFDTRAERDVPVFAEESEADSTVRGLRQERQASAELRLRACDELDRLRQARARLRFLQDREFERVGGNQTIKVDGRVIAATNRDLAAEVKAGRFREDLFYRLNVVSIEMPPLRARPSDVSLLATRALQKYATENGKWERG